MPNLQPPVTTAAAAEAYRSRILAALRASAGAAAAEGFTPLMTAYLTETIDPADLEQGFRAGVFTAAKLYPAGATTNSDAGVRDLHTIGPVLETMERIGMPLLLHGEVTSADVDIFDHSRCRGVCGSCTGQPGGHHHPPPPAHQPQCPVSRGAAA
jgi:dihydroorotase